MLPHPLTTFKIHIHYQKEFRFNSVYARNNISKIKDGAYEINLGEYKSIGSHILIVLDLKTLPKKKKSIYREQKHYDKYLSNTSI